MATVTMQTMSKAPTTPLMTTIVDILESFTVTVVMAFKIGVTVAGVVESSTVAGVVESSTVAHSNDKTSTTYLLKFF